MRSVYKGVIIFINVAKALIITNINCPALKGGAIENPPQTSVHAPLTSAREGRNAASSINEMLGS